MNFLEIETEFFADMGFLEFDPSSEQILVYYKNNNRTAIKV